jgi:hypothetical protein
VEAVALAAAIRYGRSCAPPLCPGNFDALSAPHLIFYFVSGPSRHPGAASVTLIYRQAARGGYSGPRYSHLSVDEVQGLTNENTSITNTNTSTIANTNTNITIITTTAITTTTTTTTTVTTTFITQH